MTHGGLLDQPIEDARIDFVISGGVTSNNLEATVETLEINEVHGSKKVELDLIMKGD
ncbi:hypothetical protein ACF3NG_06635 [Aerococcaceae bacterium WGS1372]